MPLLLVDDRDGRILLEIEDVDQAERVLEAWCSDEGLPDYLCLVDLRSRQGALLGADTSVKISPLS